MSKRRQLKLVSATVFLEEASPWKTFTLIISAIVIIFACLVVWSTFAKVKETAKAFGQVAPANKVDVIEHLEGGIIEKVLVQDGEQVKKGQVLLTLSSSKANAKLKQLLTRRVHLLLNQIRLQALLTNTPVEKVAWQLAFANVDMLSEAEKQKILQEETKTLKRQKLDQEQQTETIQHQLDKYKTDIDKYQKQKEAAEVNLKLYLKELGMYEKLVKKGYVSKRAYLAVQRNVATTRAELQAMTSNLAYAESQVKEYQAKLKQQQATFANDMQQELDEIDSQLAELDHEITPLQEEVSRHIIKSPDNGFVNGLDVKPGNVVDAGEKLLEVVPQTKELVARVRLSTTDVGHVSVGDVAKMKILTYDFARYGVIDGVVTHIAANSKQTKQGVPYYEVTIKPKTNYVQSDNKLPLKSGMTVEADIITGEQTLFAYILHPVQRSLNRAMSER